MSDYAERLAAANRGIRFTDIRGKQYAEVAQRILAFWSLFPNGRIETEKRDDGSRCDFTCRVFRDAADERPAATGHAFEERKGQINTTSYVENAETSAVGRALGMLGIGAATAIASADEVLAAIARQEAAKAPGRPVGARGGQEGRNGGGAPQAAAHARREAFARIAGLKAQAVANGVSEDGVNAWYEACFGETPLSRLADGQLAEVEGYLQTIVRDSSDGHLLAGEAGGAPAGEALAC